MTFKLETREQRKGERGQLNLDIGLKRKDKFKKFCKSKDLSMTSCLCQLIDYCMEGPDEQTEA